MKLYITLINSFFLLLLTSCNDKELDSNFNFNNDLYNYNYDQLYDIDAYEFLSSIEGDSIGYEFLKSHFEIVGLKVRAANKKNISVYSKLIQIIRIQLILITTRIKLLEEFLYIIILKVVV